MLQVFHKRNWLRVFAPLLMLTVGVLVAQYFLQGKERQKVAKVKPVARLVTTEVVELQSSRPVIHGYGQVIPREKVTLRSPLRGEVTSLPERMIPGNPVKRDEVMLTLDDRDYRLAIKQREADVTIARGNLASEQGRQQLARLEYQLSDRELPEDQQALVLRTPQLLDAQARLSKAEAELEQARIDWQRTRIVAPFDGHITARHTNPGSMVRDNSDLFGLVATDVFWLEASLPVNNLEWLTFDDGNADGHCNSSEVKLSNPGNWPDDVYRKGCLISLLPELDKEVRTATVLIEISDPLALQPENRGMEPVLINEFLQLEIIGNEIDKVVALPRERLINGDQVWLMDSNDQLAARKVSLLFRGRDHVLIGDGLTAGERMVTSLLPGAVPGISLRTDEQPEGRRADKKRAHREGTQSQ